MAIIFPSSVLLLFILKCIFHAGFHSSDSYTFADIHISISFSEIHCSFLLPHERYPLRVAKKIIQVQDGPEALEPCRPVLGYLLQCPPLGLVT